MLQSKRESNTMTTKIAKEPTKKSRAWDRRAMLKVKIKSLAAESKIIRSECKKHRNARFGVIADELYTHRTWNVRRESRATNLAYAFIRGKDYKTVEASFRVGHAPDWNKVEQMVIKYGKVYDPDCTSTETEANFQKMMKRFVKWKSAV